MSCINRNPSWVFEIWRIKGMATPDAENKKAAESRQKIESNPVVEGKTGNAGKGKMKKVWILVGVLILVIAGSLIFAVPYFNGERLSAPGNENADSGEKGQNSEEPVAVKATLALDPFLVNLADKNESRFLKTSFELGLAEEPDGKNAEMTVAAMRDSIITLLSSKTAEQILTPQGKDKLREQIRTRINALSSGINVVEVYIVDFVVQL